MKKGDPGYWEWRKNTGRKKAVPTPDILWEHACDYFGVIDENPAQKQDFLKGGDNAGKIIELDVMRPFTWEGFEDFLSENGVIADLEDYRYNKDNRYPEFQTVIKQIGRVIYDRNVSGAAMNFLNSNLIARYLGMAEKTQMTVKEEQPLFGDEPDGGEE